MKNFCEFIALDRKTIGPGQRAFLDDVMLSLNQSNQLMIDAIEAIKNNLANLPGARLEEDAPLINSLKSLGETCNEMYNQAIAAMNSFASAMDQEQPLQPSFKDSSSLIDRLRAGARAFQQKMQPSMEPVEAALEQVREAKNNFDQVLQSQLL
ncbi:MAG: hypothetical protein FJ390_07950 [Verrucomicrobia bacterium]|nr:hypothetical protein [Verrucomicrobiota bacterium]